MYDAYLDDSSPFVPLVDLESKVTTSTIFILFAIGIKLKKYHLYFPLNSNSLLSGTLDTLSPLKFWISLVLGL